MKQDAKMVVKRRFQNMYNPIETMIYMKYEDIRENKEIFINGFKYIKTDKIDNFILIGCESYDLFENQ